MSLNDPICLRKNSKLNLIQNITITTSYPDGGTRTISIEREDSKNPESGMAIASDVSILPPLDEQTQKLVDQLRAELRVKDY